MRPGPVWGPASEGGAVAVFGMADGDGPLTACGRWWPGRSTPRTPSCPSTSMVRTTARARAPALSRRQPGIWLSAEHPFLAGSPDGVQGSGPVGIVYETLEAHPIGSGGEDGTYYRCRRSLTGHRCVLEPVEIKRTPPRRFCGVVWAQPPGNCARGPAGRTSVRCAASARSCRIHRHGSRGGWGGAYKLGLGGRPFAAHQASRVPPEERTGGGHPTQGVNSLPSSAYYDQVHAAPSFGALTENAGTRATPI